MQEAEEIEIEPSKVLFINKYLLNISILFYGFSAANAPKGLDDVKR